MKYKVGQKVKIKSLDWYKENRNDINEVKCGVSVFVPAMTTHCGYIRTISEVFEIQKVYHILEDNDLYTWTDEMIEGLVEESLDNDMKEHQRMCDEIMDIQGIEPIEAEMEEVIHCPEGYIFKDENGNVINATKIVLEKKKKEYPKTYEECTEVLCECAIMTHGYKRDLLNALQKLLICRDAYWKIAGEEMGLGKPWEPEGENTFGIFYDRLTDETEKQNGYHGANSTLEFPTEEMRDAFKENFKDIIESCKELL